MVTRTIIKKQSRYCIILLFLLLLYPFSAHAFFGGKIESYSADSVQVAADGRVLNESKYLVTPEAMRIDGFPGAGQPEMGKMNLSMLVLIKQNRQYFYNHDKKLVYESPVDENDFNAGYKNLGDVQSEKILGKEKVSGYKCTKKEVVTTFKVMGMTSKSKVIVWESKRFEMPLRVQDEEGGLQEIRNITTGKPAQKHFKPIQGYKQVGNMMAVMGMDFGNMAMDEEPTPTTSSVTPENKKQPTTTVQETTKEQDPSKMPGVNTEDIEKALESLGNKFKNFKFGN